MMNYEWLNYDLWIYHGYIKVMMHWFFSFSFSWKFGFTKRAERHLMTLMRSYFFGFFLLCIIIHSILIIFITDNNCWWFSFSSWKKLEFILTLSSIFSLYSFFLPSYLILCTMFVCFLNIFNLNIMQKYKKTCTS